jgi:hypothetical protein
MVAKKREPMTARACCSRAAKFAACNAPRLPAAVVIRVATVTIGVPAVTIRVATVTIGVAVTIRVPAVPIRVAAVTISAVIAGVVARAAVTIRVPTVTISAVTISAVAAAVVLGIRRAGGEHEQREDAKNRFHASLLGLEFASRHESSAAAAPA